MFYFILVFVTFIQDIDGVWLSPNVWVASNVCVVLLNDGIDSWVQPRLNLGSKIQLT